MGGYSDSGEKGVRQRDSARVTRPEWWNRKTQGTSTGRMVISCDAVQFASVLLGAFQLRDWK